MLISAKSSMLPGPSLRFLVWFSFVPVLFAQGALAQNEPQIGSCSTVSESKISDEFCAGTAGWSVDGDAQNGSGLPEHKQGYIEASDDGSGGTWGWVAPQRYSDNICEFFDGSLDYSIRQSDPDPDLSGALLAVKSNVGTLLYDAPGPTGTKWTDINVRLAPGPGWSGYDDNEEFLAILANATAISIRGEYSYDFDTGGLNEVSMTRMATSSTRPDCSNLRPKFSYEVDFDPDLEGGPVEFTLALKNATRVQTFPLVTLDIVFSPDTDSTGSDRASGVFLATHNRCTRLDVSTLDFSGDKVLFTPDGADYGYQCEIAYFNPGETRALDFIQEVGVPGVTDYQFRLNTAEFDNGWSGSVAPLEVIAGSSTIEVSVPDSEEPAYTGVTYEKVFSITNIGNLNAVNPVLKIEFEGDAVPTVGGSIDLSALRISSVNADDNGTNTQACKAVDGGLHCEVMRNATASNPYLAPGETEQFVVSFTAPKAGSLSLSAYARATDYQGREITAEEDSVSVEIEGPALVIEIYEITPPSMGEITGTDDRLLHLHEGSRLEPMFTIRNASDKAILVDGFFELNLIDGSLLDFAFPAAEISCDAPFEEGSSGYFCEIGDFGPGEEVLIYAEIEYEGAVSFEASLGNLHFDWPENIGENVETLSPNILFYQTGARISPELQASFTPSPIPDPLAPIDTEETFLEAEIASGREFIAAFSVKNMVDSAVAGGTLVFRLPENQGRTLYRPAEVTGCQAMFRNGADFSCRLGVFDQNLPAEVKLELRPLTDQNVGEKHCFAWDLELPSNYVSPQSDSWADTETECYVMDDLTGGAIVYEVVPADTVLELSAIELSGFLTPEIPGGFEYSLVNTGNISAENLEIEIEAINFVAVPAGVDPDTFTAADLLSEFSVSVYAPDQPGSNNLESVDCQESGEFTVKCSLDVLAPEDAVEVSIYATALEEATGRKLHYSVEYQSENSEAGHYNIVDIREATPQSVLEGLWRHTQAPLDFNQYRCVVAEDSSYRCTIEHLSATSASHFGMAVDDVEMEGQISGNQLSGYRRYTFPRKLVDRCPELAEIQSAELVNVSVSSDGNRIQGQRRQPNLVSYDSCTIDGFETVNLDLTRVAK